MKANKHRVLFFLFVFSAIANATQLCVVDQNCTIGEFVYNNSFVPYTTSICNISIYDTLDTLVVNNAPLLATSLGLQYYIYQPTQIGSYSSFLRCSAQNSTDIIDKGFLSVTNTTTGGGGLSSEERGWLGGLYNCLQGGVCTNWWIEWAIKFFGLAG